MNDKLEISRELRDKILELHLQGRLDAYSAVVITEEIEEDIRMGHYDIILNLEKVNYVSSAGIRVLVKYYKQLKTVNGNMSISSISDEAKSVLEMVGLLDMLLNDVSVKSEAGEENGMESLSNNGMLYDRTVLQQGTRLKCNFHGNPMKVHSSNFSAEELRTEKFSKNKYGIGFGAFGHDYEDCSNRFGEFIGIGDSVAYLPSDGSNTPDYTLKSGKLIPEINMLYGIIFEGIFSELYHFKSKSESGSISFSKLINDISSFSKFDTAGFVMIAETSGLIGASFLNAPTKLDSGFSPFRFPEIRDYLNFTTEAEFKNMLTVTVGISIKDPPDNYKFILRPLSKKLNIWGHFHTAVFYFHPIGKKQIDLNETMHTLFETDKIQQVLHLINDERHISGIGESEFVHGRCWVGPLDVELKEKQENKL